MIDDITEAEILEKTAGTGFGELHGHHLRQKRGLVSSLVCRNAARGLGLDLSAMATR
jgi:hypothetical protein